MKEGEAEDEKKSNEEKGSQERNQSESAYLDLPKFDGNGFCFWRNKCEQCFQLEETPDPQKLKMIFKSLEGKDYPWQQHYM